MSRLSSEPLAQQVRHANRRFYDLAAAQYEAVDGRRTTAVLAWISERMAALSQRCGGGRLLDIGCGSGVVLGCAEDYFVQRVGVDISSEILKLAQKHGEAVCADAAQLPFAEGSFDAVVCFAALHHIYDHQPLLAEVYRILKPGGIFYSDHDMSRAFSDRFHWPLQLYRTLFNAQRRYQQADSRLDAELYRLTEIHEQGIDQESLITAMSAAGFAQVDASYHWYGLNGLLDRMRGTQPRGKGWAPLLTVYAVR
ncbi:MAG: class I SAM-dependent methyltransferase [Gammaproteobacteria bacterium]|nr:class I SAM-dependent methyltransferase [Gammaproteobacteria bacterium]